MMIESNMDNDHTWIEIRQDEGNLTGANNVEGQILSENRNDEDELLASSIRGKFLEPPPSPPCIFKIPKIFQGPNEAELILPKLVSIGPYHHGKKNLQAMERIKLCYLHCLLNRTPTPDTTLKHLVKRVRAIEQACRDCYDEKIDMSSHQFVEMMVVDGCFVIEFMLGRTYSKILRNDPLSQSSWMRTPLISDFFLLENQLPWLVLDCLFQYLVNENADDEPVGKHKFLSELTLKFCQLHTMRFLKPNDGASEIRHLLDHIRIGIVGPEKLTISSRRYLVPSVTELRQIGVIFKRGDMSCHTLNIAFHNGVMEIPEICIGNNRSLFINFIALEECQQGLIGYAFTSYARVLHYLIKSSKDAEFLMQKGIIHTTLSKEDITCLFNSIHDNTTPTSESFVILTRNVHLYCKHRWLRRCLISIKQDYLYNPSSVWSLSNAVIIIVILSIAQTIYTLLSYYKS